MRRISFSIASVVALIVLAIGTALAETPQDTCDRLAGDTVPVQQVDAASAVSACAAAVKAAPGTPRLEYEYGRSLEKSGSIDQAKEMYQWASDDGFEAATAALARINAQPPSPASSESDRRQQLASQLDALADVAGRIAKTAPRDHDDPIAVLALTGMDPAAILRWVQTNTRLIAYVGTLRGSSGVLMDRAGNSLDRSLLLADLLRHAGNDVRIARAQLDPPAAAALRAQVQASTPKPSPPAPLDRPALLKTLDDPRLDHNLVEKAVDQTIAENQHFQASVKDLYDKVYPAVIEAVGNDPKRDQQIAADAEVALRDHFWVQRRIASGWEDLDPDAEVVHKLTPATTFALDQIPDDLKHRVTLRLILETWSAGKLSETKLLERSWAPLELTGKSITLSHALLPQPSIGQIAQQPDPQSMYIDGLTKAWVIEPILRVGDETVTDKLYTLGGQVLPAGNYALAQLGVSGNLANFGKLASGLGGAFGGGQTAPQYGPPNEATASIKVTAEWVEFDIDAPGRPRQRHRRAVFDLIGPAERAGGSIAPRAIDKDGRIRRALALTGEVELFIFGATPAESWIQLLASQRLEVAAQQAAATNRSARSLSDELSEAHRDQRLDLPLWSWGLVRASLQGLPSAAPVQPNIALLWHTLALDPKGTIVTRFAFDIVSNAAQPAVAFNDRVAQGVLDTVIEHALLARNEPGGNTAALYATDLSSKRPWNLLGPTTRGVVDRLSISADAKARIRSDLAHGYLLIVPEWPTAVQTGGSFAWWRIDPATGTTVGLGENGMGVEEAGEGLLFRTVLSKGICMAVAVTGIVVNHTDASSAALFMYCNWSAMGSAIAISAGSHAGMIEVIDLLLTYFEEYNLGKHAWGGGHGGHE